MKLRRLKLQDAPLMLEWMHDDTVVHDLRTDFGQKKLEDCISFIEQSNMISDSLNLAIVDDDDEYMGTVSLKHITLESAEFGITVRKCAMGKGYSDFGMKEIIRIGFEQYSLKSIFWCVDPNNARAIRFYDKHGYERCSAPDTDYYTLEEKEAFVWYCIHHDTVYK